MAKNRKQKDLKDYLQLKKEAEEAQQQADKAEGALEGVMKRLKDEFGCKSLESAEKKLKELEKIEKKAKKDFAAAVEKFEEDWKNESD